MNKQIFSRAGRGLGISMPAFLATATAALLMLASCSSDEIDSTTPNNGRGIPLRFTVSLGSDAPGHGPQRAMGSDSVKGSDYDQLHTFWAEGDKVSLVLYHKGKPTVSVATLGELDDTKRLGTFTTVLDPCAEKGDEVTAFYPALDKNGLLSIDYTHQNGKVETLDAFDPSSGSALLSTIDESGATLEHNIYMKPSVRAEKQGKEAAVAYYGVKIEQEKTDSKGKVTRTPLKVKKLTLSARDKEEGNGWVTFLKLNPLLAQFEAGSKLPSDSIVVVPEDSSATLDRLYMAVPIANDGQTATFQAQDENGFVYTVDKVIPAKPGTYYPITLQMKLAESVDMGDTVEWAQKNVGADDPEDYGDYFAWGETYPKSYYYWLPQAYKDYGDMYMYKWGCDQEGLTKYNTTDHKYILDPADDAASANWGLPWRMPYTDEIWRLAYRKLYKHEVVKVKNVEGKYITGEKITCLKNGNALFFPFAGFKYGGSLYSEGTSAYYWGKELYRSGGVGPDGKVPPGTSANIYNAQDFCNAEGQGWGVGGGSQRFEGMPVRPVRATKNVTHVKTKE